MKDDLNTLLKTWSPNQQSAADIRAGVWQRIERIEPAGWKTSLQAMVAYFMRPALATGLVAVAILAAITVGSIVSETAQTQAYLNSLTAFRMQ